MNDSAYQGGGTGPSHRAVEIGVSVAMAAFGLIVIVGSLRVGIGWGAEGPKSGFFPFYLGLVIVGASAVNAAQMAGAYDKRKLFATWEQLGQVMSIVVPTAAYVVVIPWIGIYVASMVLIATFMMWLGKYRWQHSLPIAVAVMVCTYLTFERWFLVPLPKGPIEDLLGL